MQNEKIDSIVDLAASLASKADQIDQVLIIYRRKDEGEDVSHGSMDNGLRLDECNWLVDAFKFWLHMGAIGLLPKQGESQDD